MGWKAKTGRWLLTAVIKPLAEKLIRTVKDDEKRDRRKPRPKP
jgi:hypothetical protein